MQGEKGEEGDGDRDDDHPRGGRKLFDVKRLPFGTTPTGIGYVQSEKLFVFDDPTQLDTLIFSDERGNPAGTRTIVFPPGYVPLHCEALAYVPRESSVFPDHILEVTYDGDLWSHILVINRTGVVDADIVPDDPEVQYNGLVGVSFVAPDRFLVSVARNTLFLLDLSGHTVTGPVTVPEVGQFSGLEGVGSLADGRIVATDADTGRVFAFDGTLHRTPDADQDYTVGVGLSHPVGPAWDPDAKRYLFVDTFAATLDKVSRSVRNKTVVADLGAAGLAAFDIRDVFDVADQDRIGIPLLGTRSPFVRELLLFDEGGHQQGTINTLSVGRPFRASYFDATHEYGVVVTTASTNGTIKVVDGTGAAVRTIDLRPYIGAVRPRDFAYFNPTHPSGGELLVLTGNTLLVVDLNGNRIAQVSYAAALDMKFGANYVTAITSGPQAGAFAARAVGTNELVVFRLP